MVTPVFVGLVGVYLCIKYGVLTSGAKQVVATAGPVAPAVLVSAALVWFGDNPQYDVLVLVLSAMPLLSPQSITTLVATYAACIAAVRFAVVGMVPLVPISLAAAAISVASKTVLVLFPRRKQL